MNTNDNRNDDRRMLLDPYDLAVASLNDQQDALKTKPTTLRAIAPIIGTVSTFTIQTFRAADGDTVFLEYLDAQGSRRIVIPPNVTAAIARQRDSLTTTGRSRRGKAAAEARKEDGRPNPLNDPAVRAKALAARKAKAKKKKAKIAGRRVTV